MAHDPAFRTSIVIRPAVTPAESTHLGLIEKPHRVTVIGLDDHSEVRPAAFIGTAREIWDLAEKPTTAQCVAESPSAQHTVPTSNLIDDLGDYLERLVEAGLIAGKLRRTRV